MINLKFELGHGDGLREIIMTIDLPRVGECNRRLPGVKLTPAEV